MQLLEERIRKDGIIKEGNVLKVDRFLNHQMDIHLFSPHRWNPTLTAESMTSSYQKNSFLPTTESC